MLPLCLSASAAAAYAAASAAASAGYQRDHHRHPQDKEAEEQEKVFRDPDFDAVASSLYRNPFQAPRGALPPGMIEWNSVGGLEVEAIDQPALFKQTNVERKQSDAMLGTPTGNVCQGALKNCWLVGACAVLASKPEMVKALFVSAAYADQGLYTLRMYKAGLLRYVHVDDRLPCNQAGALHYARGLDINEVWVPIVEKVGRQFMPGHRA